MQLIQFYFQNELFEEYLILIYLNHLKTYFLSNDEPIDWNNKINCCTSYLLNLKFFKDDETILSHALEFYQLIPEEEIEDSEMPLYKLLDPSKGYPQVVSFSSNVLVVDSNNIIFDRDLPKLFEFMKTIGVKCHVSVMRHRKFWAAGIHCSTLDIRRRGNKRKIINEI